MTKSEQSARRHAIEAPVLNSVGDESPYKYGPYVVHTDGDFGDILDCSIVYITQKGQDLVEAEVSEGSTRRGFSVVPVSESEVIPLTDLISAYNQVHGTDI